MATIKKLITMDDVEDQDIIEFLNNARNRKQSQIIREALRMYMGQSIEPTFGQPKKRKKDVKKVDAPLSIFKMGS